MTTQNVHTSGTWSGISIVSTPVPDRTGVQVWCIHSISEHRYPYIQTWNISLSSRTWTRTFKYGVPLYQTAQVPDIQEWIIVVSVITDVGWGVSDYLCGEQGLGICLERDRDLVGEICTGVLHSTHTRPTYRCGLDSRLRTQLGYGSHPTQRT
jgi:hypothetical protein